MFLLHIDINSLILYINLDKKMFLYLEEISDL